jgi:hypothetical protein
LVSKTVGMLMPSLEFCSDPDPQHPPDVELLARQRPSDQADLEVVPVDALETHDGLLLLRRTQADIRIARSAAMPAQRVASSRFACDLRFGSRAGRNARALVAWTTSARQRSGRTVRYWFSFPKSHPASGGTASCKTSAPSSWPTRCVGTAT